MPDQDPSYPKHPPSQVLRVMVRNREKVIYDGAAWAVSSLNERGVFDILPEHINFITMIKDTLTIHKPDKTLQEYKIRTGLMRVSSNVIEIYVGLAGQQPRQT
jgi:F0F1-type ATP synthase epsilon subunit